MNEIIKLSVIFSLVNATVIVTFLKWNLFDYFHRVKPRFLLWYPDCIWCYGFQLSALETIVYFCLNKHVSILLVPFVCTAFTSILVKKILNENN